MKNIMLVFVIGTLGMVSCKKEQRIFTKEEIQHTIDSVVSARAKESDIQAQQDLERRMKIEVRVKVDSILNARSKKLVKDTLNKQAIKPIPGNAVSHPPMGLPPRKAGGI